VNAMTERREEAAQSFQHAFRVYLKKLVVPVVLVFWIKKFQGATVQFLSVSYDPSVFGSLPFQALLEMKFDFKVGVQKVFDFVFHVR
jgi:hypothetical protein